MTRAVAVLRPEPGNARTAAALEAAGLAAIRLPLFNVEQVAWMPPDHCAYDAILLTSANAVRHAGSGLDRLTGLPVVAVGAATAAAARARGFVVAGSGTGDAAAAVEQAASLGFSRLLHLAGLNHVATAAARTIVVYASERAAVDVATVAGQVAMLHSVRAAQYFSELVNGAGIDRGSIRLAALSEAVRRAAGTGWDRADSAAMPDDARLVALARALAD